MILSVWKILNNMAQLIKSTLEKNIIIFLKYIQQMLREYVNSLQAGVAFLYPLKRSENFWCFQGV